MSINDKMTYAAFTFILPTNFSNNIVNYIDPNYIKRENLYK